MNDQAGFRRHVVVSNEPETDDVRTFVLRPEDGSAPSFRPGQAMTLALDVAGRRLYRTFSLAAPHNADGTVAMTIKSQPGNGATAWMHAQLRPGMVIEAKGPQGRFVLAEAPSERIALVSAGSGAAPLMAMLRFMAARMPDADVAWFHAAKSATDILFASELARLQTAMPRLAVTVALSRPGPGWFGYRGRTTRRMLSTAVPDFGRREVYCCGPAGFMDDVRLIHAAEGGGLEHFHVENFGPVTPPATAEAASAETNAEAFKVRLGERSFAVRAGETLLAAATRQVVVIPCGCASGMCGTCLTKLLDGTVEMNHQGGISAEEEADGYILACCSRPLSDLVIAT